MARSEVGIVNLALAEIGVPAISAMTEKSDAAELANAIWDYARDEVLEDADWNFAKDTVELAQDSTAPVDPEWNYRYGKPASCIKIRTLIDEAGETKIEYAVEGDFIYCNYDNTDVSLYARYTAIKTDVTKYSASFIRALKYKLAGMMARKLASRDPEPFEQKYEVALLKATGQNQMQDYVEGEQGNTDWIDR